MTTEHVEARTNPPGAEFLATLLSDGENQQKSKGPRFEKTDDSKVCKKNPNGEGNAPGVSIPADGVKISPLGGAARSEWLKDGLGSSAEDSLTIVRPVCELGEMCPDHVDLCHGPVVLGPHCRVDEQVNSSERKKDLPVLSEGNQGVRVQSVQKCDFGQGSDHKNWEHHDSDGFGGEEDPGEGGVCIEDLIVLMTSMTHKHAEHSIKSAEEAIKANAEDLNALHEKNIKDIQKECEAWAKLHSPLTVFLKALMVVFLFIIAIVSVVLAVITVNPVFIIGAVAAILGLVNSVLGCVSQAIGKDITFTGLVVRFAAYLKDYFQQQGFPPDKAKALADVIAGGVGILSGSFLGDPGVVGVFIQGIAEGCGASEGTAQMIAAIFVAVFIVLMMIVLFRSASAGSLSRAMMTLCERLGGEFAVSQLAKTVPHAFSGLESVSSGCSSGLTIYSGYAEKEVGMAEAAVLMIRALLGFVQSEMNNDNTFLRNIAREDQSIETTCNEIVKTVVSLKGKPFQHMV